MTKDLSAPGGVKPAGFHGIWCSMASIFLNLILCAVKFFAAAVSGSAAIGADGFNNLADAGVCFGELLGFTVAGFGAGEIHPFGHGRAEWVMGLGSAVLVLLMGVETAKTSLTAIGNPQPLNFHPFIFIILGFSLVVKFFMFVYNRGIGNKIHSPALKAKAYDCLGDMGATGAVLLSAIAGHFWGLQADGWCGLAVSLFILWAGIEALKETAGPLIGSAPDKELLKTVETVCAGFPAVTGVYDLMVHDYGFSRRALSLRIGGDSRESRDDLIDLPWAVGEALEQATGAGVTVQLELQLRDGEQINTLNRIIEERLAKWQGAVQIKNLRLVCHSSRQIALMDGIINPHYSRYSGEIKTEIAQAVRLWDEDTGSAVQIKMSGAHHRKQR